MSDIDLRYTDKRTAERYLRMGLLDEKAYEKHLKSLPDLLEKASKIEATLPEDEMDEDLEKNDEG